MDINGKVAVVTGGASGIGQAVTRRIAAAGGKLVIFDLNEDAGQAMVAEIGADNCVFANVHCIILHLWSRFTNNSCRRRRVLLKFLHIRICLRFFGRSNGVHRAQSTHEKCVARRNRVV